MTSPTHSLRFTIKTWVSRLALAVATAGVTVPPPCRADTSPIEYQIKAAYLYNFVKYVDWPASALAGDNSSLTVCILGKDPFGNAIAPLAGRAVKNRTLVVKHISHIEEMGGCQVLFICSSEKKHLAQIIGAIKTPGVLTVSDAKRFAEVGGMIGFVNQGEKVRFEINLKSARQAGLRISPQLLKLASSLIE